MTVREALEKLATYRHSNEPPLLEIRTLAPKIEAALRETALEMRRRLGVKGGDFLVDVCVTAGIEAMQ